MSRITIEYQAEGKKNLSRQLMAAVFEVLEQNHAECTSFSHMEQKNKTLAVPAFMDGSR